MEEQNTIRMTPNPMLVTLPSSLKSLEVKYADFKHNKK